jgi:F-type H+-transporting ATPase subunit epsilon
VARTRFQVEVLTPEGEVFNDEVEMVSTRTSTGSIGILAHHTPLLATLDPAELRLYRSATDVVRYAQGEGYLQVAENRALILVEEAQPPASLDPAELREKLRTAEEDYAKAEPGTEQQRLAARERRRWETFARIAEE